MATDFAQGPAPSAVQEVRRNMKQTKCHECWGLNGRHWPTCVTRGYGAVGPHPDAPACDTEPPTDRAEPEMCCGGTCVRALCFIHSTEPRPEPKGRAEPCELDSWGDPDDPNNPLAFTGRKATACGHYVQTFRAGKLVDEEPIEAYTAVVKMTVTLPGVIENVVVDGVIEL